MENTKIPKLSSAKRDPSSPKSTTFSNPDYQTPPTRTDTPKQTTNDDYNIDKRHRAIFLDISFPKIDQTVNTTNTSGTRQSILLSVEDYNEHLRILRHWNLEGHINEVTGEYMTQIEFRRSVNRSWYEKVKYYRVGLSMAQDGSRLELLERIDEKSNVWKRVVHKENVYDAILECHGVEEHKGFYQTKQEVSKKFWNITETLCRNFIRTCPICNDNRNKGKTPGRTPTNKRRASVNKILTGTESDPFHQYIDQYEISVIAYREKALVDLRGITMSYVLIVHDNQINWTVLRPLPALDHVSLENELTMIFCIKGHPRFQGNTPLQFIVARLIDRFWDRHNMNIDSIKSIPDKKERRLRKHEIERFQVLDARVRDCITRAELSYRRIVNKSPDWITILQNATVDINADTTNTSPQQSTTIDNEFRDFIASSLPNTELEGITSQPVYTVPSSPMEVEVVHKELPSENIDQDETMMDPHENTEPSTQSTLSQIDELMDDASLAPQVKEVYTNANVDIRSFFAIHPKDTSEQPDEVQMISPPPPSADQYPPFPNPSTHIAMTVKDAFKNRKTSTRTIDDIEYQLCHPKLVCDRCDLYAPSRMITVAEDDYYVLHCQNDRWFYPDLLTTFGILCCHDAHRSDMIYVDATLPSVSNESGRIKTSPLPPSVKTIVSVIFNNDHFAVMRVCLDEERAYFYDGLNWKLSNWASHMKHILNRYGITKKTFKAKLGTGNDGMDGIKIKQQDGSNCGPIACMVLWKLFKPNEVHLHRIQPTNFRILVINELRRLTEKHDNSCFVYKKRARVIDDQDTTSTTLEEEIQGNIVTSSRLPKLGSPKAATMSTNEEQGSSSTTMVTSSKGKSHTQKGPDNERKIPQNETTDSCGLVDSPEQPVTKKKTLQKQSHPTTPPRKSVKRKIVDDEDEEYVYDGPVSKISAKSTKRTKSKNFASPTRSTPPISDQKKPEKLLFATEHSQTKSQIEEPNKTDVGQSGDSEEENEFDLLCARHEQKTQKEIESQSKIDGTTQLMKSAAIQPSPSSQEHNDETPTMDSDPPKKVRSTIAEDPPLKKLSGTDAEKKSFFDGLSDSEDDDDRHVEKPGTIDLNPPLPSTEDKVSIDHRDQNPIQSKTRIKIPLVGTSKTKRSKCHCKKECNKKCGCRKKGQKCTIFCNCKGECKTNRKS